jgi:putative membrane protein
LRLRSVARWSRLALMLAGSSVVAYLLYQVGPYAVWASIRALGWRLLIILAGPSSAALVLDALGWRVLLRDHGIPLKVLLRARLAGEAVNMITPAASVGGEPLKAYLLRPYAPLSEGLASVVVDKTTVLASQVFLLLGGLCLGVTMLPFSHPLMRVMGALLGVEIVAASGFVLVQTRGVFGGGGRILGRLGVGPTERYQTGLNAVDHGLTRLYQDRWAGVLASGLLHFMAWASGALEVYLFLVFLGVDASLAVALVIEAFGSAVKFAGFMIPASLGVLEGGYVAIFAALGLGGPVGLSYTVVRRLREAVYAIIGLLWLAVLRARPWLAEQADARHLTRSRGGTRS